MTLKKLSLFSILLFYVCISFSQKSFTLSGYVTDSETGEGLIGATIYSKSTGRGASTNAYGFYSLTLPSDTVTVTINFIGYLSQVIKLTNDNFNKPFDVKISINATQMAEVKIVGFSEQKEILRSTEGSVVSVPMQQIKLIPSVLGESDVIKALQLMPGVTAGGELSSSFFVRGGEADQNLVILDEAVVYNSGHLLGFFSIFNSDVIKDVKLYKGGFPACYGGRLSAVMDVRMKDGNLKEVHGSGSVGILSTKITVEGPIIKEKLSFIISGRRTYVDKVYGMFGAEIPYYFYDLNAKLNWKIGSKDRIYLSTYLGNDILYMPDISLEEDSTQIDTAQVIAMPTFGFNLGNKTVTLRWNHQFNSKLFCNTSIIYNNFKYDLNAEDGYNTLLIRSSLEDYSLKSDFEYNLNSFNQIQFGALVTQHFFSPNMVFAKGEISDYLGSQDVQLLQTTESSAYLLDEFELFKKLKINAGLRYTFVVNEKTIYKGLEPRLFVNWMMNEKNSFKFGYSRMNQYLHRVSSSNFVLPTDMYYPVTKLIKPQKADQIFASFTRNFIDADVLITLEAYQKEMYNLIEFREGTKLFLNNNFENDLLTGTGNSYGFEFLLQKMSGTLSGWFSYSYNVSNRLFEGLNQGLEFPAKNDRRHNLAIVGIIKLADKLDLSTSWIYMTGGRFTSIENNIIMQNSAGTGWEIIPIFEARNATEMSENHRLDVSLTYKPHIGKNKKFKSEWVFGVYNLYNRAAPYRIDIVYDERGFYEYQQPGLFGRIFNVSFNFTF